MVPYLVLALVDLTSASSVAVKTADAAGGGGGAGGGGRGAGGGGGGGGAGGGGGGAGDCRAPVVSTSRGGSAVSRLAYSALSVEALDRAKP
jgi:hypothetical protein